MATMDVTPTRAGATLRQLLEDILRGRMVSLPVMVAVNDDASAALQAEPQTGVTQLTPRIEWRAEDVKKLADNVCLVVDAARPATGEEELRLLIGRSRRCDYRIADESVSGVHAIMGIDQDTLGYFLCDAHSRNGTFIDGHRVDPDVRVPLWPAAFVTFGQAVFYFLDPPTLRKLATLLK